MRRLSAFVNCEGEECGECHLKRMHSNAYPEDYACVLFSVQLNVEGNWREGLKIFRCVECKDKEIKE